MRLPRFALLLLCGVILSGCIVWHDDRPPPPPDRPLGYDRGPPRDYDRGPLPGYDRGPPPPRY